MMRSCLESLRKAFAPIGRHLLSGPRWDDAEVRAYLDRPRPTPELGIVGLIVVLSMGVAAVNIAWFLLSQIKG